MVSGAENLNQIVGPVLRSGFVAILNDNLETAAPFCRDPFQNSTDVVVKMIAYVFLTHLVAFQPSGVWHGRTIFRAGADHAKTSDHPIASGHTPCQSAFRIHLASQVQNAVGGDD